MSGSTSSGAAWVAGNRLLPWALPAVAVALPVAAATVASRWMTAPVMGALALAAVVVIGAIRFARLQGALGTWTAALSLSILAGELSAVSLGGQSGKLLWADAVLVAGLVGVVLRSHLRIELPRAPFVLVLIPLLLWSAFTLLFARDPLTGIAELKEWCVAVVAGAVGASFAADERRARGLLAVVAVTGSLVAVHMVVTALQSPWGPVLAVLLKQVDLPWGRTNYLAGLLILALPISLGLMGHAHSWKARLGWLAVLATNATGLVFSASKGAIVAVVAALLVSFVRGGRTARIAAAVMASVVGIGAALFLVGPLQGVLRYRLQRSALEYSVGERMNLYRLAWDEFTRNPVTGLGINNFSVASNRLTGVDTVPHNLELGALAELGIPGLALTLAWVVALGVTAWRARSRARTARDRSLGLALWAAFVAFLVHNQVESTLYGEQYKILLVLVAAATWRLATEWSRSEDPSPA